MWTSRVRGVCLWAALCSSAGAVEFVVNTTVDAPDAMVGDAQALTSEGRTSLRAAVQEANFLGGSHVIRVPAGIYLLGLNAADDATPATGDLDISANLEIVGDGDEVTILDGGFGSNRVFDIFPQAVPVGATCTIRNLTIRNARDAADDGGAIRFNANGSTGTALNLIGCTLQDNRTSGFGGALATDNGNITISGCRFIGNQADVSGGAYYEAGIRTIAITNSTFSFNACVDRGGAIYFNGSNGETTTIAGSMFNNNNTDGQGGAIYNNDPDLTITDSNLTANTAGTGGGGLWIDGRNATLIRVLVTNNLAQAQGGGMYLASDSRAIQLTDSEILGNVSFDEGGGVHGQGSDIDLVLEQVVVAANVADTRGGGINFYDGTLVVSASTIAQNTGGSDGGGINAEDVQMLRVRDSTIAENFGCFGGLEIDSVPDFQVINSTFAGNVSSGGCDGGGIDVFRSIGLIANVTIADNKSANRAGGLFVDNVNTAVTIQNTIIVGNSATANFPDVLVNNAVVLPDSGNNLIGDLTEVPDLAAVPNTITNVNRNSVLGSLGSFGGPTDTIPLTLGGPAINAGNNAFVLPDTGTDQRLGGFARTVGGTVDLGAFEVQDQPQIASVTPSQGVAGTQITISGSGFQPGLQVRLGSNLATSANFINFTTAVAVVPAAPASTVDVTLTNPDLQSIVAAAAFQYLGTDVDSDKDGFSDAIEIAVGSNPNDPSSTPTLDDVGGPDSDGDGFSDALELALGTSPNDPTSKPNLNPPAPPAPPVDGLPDSDNDGFADAIEAAAGTHPNDPNSFPELDMEATGCATCGSGGITLATLMLAVFFVGRRRPASL